MRVLIEPVGTDAAPALAAVLARAFLRDPMVAWPMATEDGLEERLRTMFELVDTPYADEGWLYRAADGLGVMTLLPPGSEARQLAVDLAAADAVSRLTGDAGTRYAALWDWVAATMPDEPHWLLDQLAVDPPAQGRGIGGAMLRFAVERAEADDVPLFLETGVAGNVPLYERFGLRVMIEGDAPGGGPHIWFMRRDPRGPGPEPGVERAVPPTGP
jgi:GNAT superfamily N-acetyltransferase